MKIKVKAKKGTYQTLFETYTIVALFAAIDAFFIYQMAAYDNFNDLLSDYGVAIPLVLIFALVVISSIAYTIKPAKKYSAILKKYYTKGEKHIYEFTQENTKAWNSGKEYVIESDEPLALTLNDKYALYLKELNWEPKYLDLDPITETYASKITIKHQLKFVIWTVASVPILLFAMCIYGMIYFPNYWYAYLIVLVLLLFALLFIIKLLREVDK